jgi:uncharacterized membrane protein YjfL (UPF0719 family)
MEVGVKRTTIARIAAGLGALCGVVGLFTAITKDMVILLPPHGWGTGGVLLLLIALYVLADGMISFEKSHMDGHKH